MQGGYPFYPDSGWLGYFENGQYILWNTIWSSTRDRKPQRERCGVCIGLTENPVALRRWMLSGPELSRLRKQFESEYFSDNDPDNLQNFLNHKQGLSTQKTFQRQVTSLSSIIRKMGNPFLADFSDLVSLDGQDCAHESVITALYTLEDTGKEQCSNSIGRTKPIYSWTH